jgi:hypothetical protein
MKFTSIVILAFILLLAVFIALDVLILNAQGLSFIFRG